ncbi:glycine zipper 2TM domain-containing protein [Pseudoxanthomonas sp. LjRoot143]|uniref:glycine zipper 2TM domain-containing protein n=1 Tax=Pseudoxanthomonas sp. LjRoot143 TaxID=3342266 RepID=UPI003ED05597
MKRLSAAVMAAGLLVAGVTSAQTSRQYGTSDRYGDEPYSDYARVVRVDPIIDGGYRDARSTTSQRCYYRDADDVYARDVYGNDPYGNRGYGDVYDNGDYRDVYGQDRYGERRVSNGSTETGRTVATVIGGIAGAVLGSKVGDGSGRYVGTAVGSMVGGMAGRSIYENSQRNRQVQRGQVRVCDPEPVNDSRYGGDYYGDGRVSGYDVTYEYGGRTYRTRTGYHPGDRMRVRVDVRPE